MPSGTWKREPANDRWSDPRNWEGGAVPDERAVLGRSTVTSICFDASSFRLDTLEFSADAPVYQLIFGPGAATPALTVSGAVVNRSTEVQRVVVKANPDPHSAPQLAFTGEAVAGDGSLAYEVGPTSLERGYAGGIVAFSGRASAGQARFTVYTGAVSPPPGPVGGEVRFLEQSSACEASFEVHGTLGTDGDTFGNVVFHDQAVAERASFCNVGGTVPHGDGGNTQFFDRSDAGCATIQNRGGTVAEANGGDAAFDGIATAGQATIINHAAPVEGAYGGVTSFNNNPPSVQTGGASAGQARITNHGATDDQRGGGGHTSFSARYGSPSAGSAQIVNKGSALAQRSSAGHTYLSKQSGSPYAPDGGTATFVNEAAPVAGGAPGYTELTVWDDGDGGDGGPAPSAGRATFDNLGATVPGAAGGTTVFGAGTTAAASTLVARAGTGGGAGGSIRFYDGACGGSSTIVLEAGGTLDLSGRSEPLRCARFSSDGGVLRIDAGGPGLRAEEIHVGALHFDFVGADVELGRRYRLLEAPGLGDTPIEAFTGRIEGLASAFTLDGDVLDVQFLIDPPRMG